MPKKAPTSAKTVKTKTASASSSDSPKQRTIAAPKYRSFRLQKKLPKPETVKLPGNFVILRRSVSILARHWKLFMGIIAICAVLNLLLVQGFFAADVNAAKSSVEAGTQGLGKFFSGLSVLGTISASAGTDASTSAYRFILLVIASLATIWALRQVSAGEKVTIRDSFYQGMYPMIPFILVFLFASLQLAPMALTLYLYSMSASTGLEIILWAVILVLVAGVTLYMLSSTLFALYISTLAGMRPVAALRSALNLVRYRRFLVIRRVLFLPLILILGIGAIMLPTIAFITPAATVIFFVLIMLIIPIIHSYMYAVYRELLHEKE